MFVKLLQICPGYPHCPWKFFVVFFPLQSPWLHTNMSTVIMSVLVLAQHVQPRGSQCLTAVCGLEQAGRPRWTFKSSHRSKKLKGVITVFLHHSWLLSQKRINLSKKYDCLQISQQFRFCWCRIEGVPLIFYKR